MRGSRLIAAARALDQHVGRLAGGTRVLVDTRTPMNLSVLAPVWRLLAVDARLDLRFTAEDEAGARALLARHGLADRFCVRDRLRWMRLDLAITADAWNHAVLHRCRRRVNFFHGVAGKYDLDRPERLGSSPFATMDRIAFINEDRRQRYLDAGLVRPDQAVLVGFPKLDDLINGAWPAAATRSSLGLDPARATVLLAPTFSTANALHQAGETLVGALLETGANVIVKLHDRTRTPSVRYTNGVDWPERLRTAFGASPRFALADGADAGPYLAAADVLVTDHSTVGFEFALLDRPIVVYDAPRLQAAARIDPGKWNLLRSMADVVDTPDTLRQAVTAALRAPDTRRQARRAARDLFAYPGEAAGRATALVYELLDLTPVSETAPHDALHRHRHA